MKNLTIKNLSRIVTAALALIAVILVYSNSISSKKISRIEQAWHNFEDGRSEKAIALSTLYREIGYGGVIHHFKNFILRGDQALSQKISSHIIAAKTVLKRYELVELSPAEIESLPIILAMLDSYQENLVTVLKMTAAGLDPEDIDRYVKVDDDPALLALNLLMQNTGISSNNITEH